MMNTLQLDSVNMLPMKTWKHLRMNGESLELNYHVPQGFLGNAQVTLDDGLQILKELPGDVQSKLDATTNNQESLVAFLKESATSNRIVRIPEKMQCSSPVRIDWVLNDEAPTVLDTLTLIAEKGSEAVFIHKYEADASEKSLLHAGMVSVYAAAGSQLTYVQVHQLNSLSCAVSNLTIFAEAKAQITVVQVILGEGKAYIGTEVVLQESGSEIQFGSMHVGSGNGYTDLNYHLHHFGKETHSNLLVRGALLEKSSKLFRGTLDFHRGCTDATGVEDEYTFMLSPTVRNRSVPLILCGEEAVQGEHAVSSGALDSGALFYLTSRGIDQDLAKKLLVEAQFEPIFSLIPDERTIHAVKESIKKRMDSRE